MAVSAPGSRRSGAVGGRRAARWSPAFEPLEGRSLASAGLTAARMFVGPFRAAAGPAEVLGVHAQARRLGGGGAPGGVRVLTNVAYAPGEHLDLFIPTGPAPAGGRPVILALPGGGWRWVRRQDLEVTVSQFARLGYVVAVADYAYSNGQPGDRVFPANIDDVRQAVRWLRTNAGRFGIDTNRVAVWGESAGGHLASLLGADPGDPSARVQAVIDFYGPADLTKLYNEAPNDRMYLQTFLGGSPDQVPGLYQDASPVTHVAPGDPPFFIEQGMADNACPPDQSAELAAALRAAGVPVHTDFWPSQSHGFRLQAYPGVNLLGPILNFLDEALNHGGQGIS